MKRQVSLDYLYNFLKLTPPVLKESLDSLIAVGAITSYYIGKSTVFIDTEHATLPIFNDPEIDNRPPMDSKAGCRRVKSRRNDDPEDNF